MQNSQEGTEMRRLTTFDDFVTGLVLGTFLIVGGLFYPFWIAGPRWRRAIRMALGGEIYA
jgi:hypothetical protein